MEAPHLSRLAEQYRKDGLVVLAVNAWNEKRDVLERFVSEKKLEYRILLDPGHEVSGRIYPGVLPSVYWIDRGGVIRDFEVGFHGSSSLERKTQRLLAGGS